MSIIGIQKIIKTLVYKINHQFHAIFYKINK